MKVKPNLWRISWRFLVTFLIVVTIISILSYSLFFYIDLAAGKIYIIKWDYRQIIFVSVIFAISVVFYILTVRSFYYMIESKSFIVKRYSKEVEYAYDSVIFIYEEKSEKKKKIYFYTEKGGMTSLLQDEENKLYTTMLKKCQNRMSIEEFRRVHPEEKL